MKKLLTLILVLVLSTFAYAGTVSTYKSYSTGDEVTALNLNGNFNNIRTVLNGGLDNENTDTSQFRFIEILGSDPAAGNQGRVVFNKSENTLKFDTGSVFIGVGVLPNSQTWGGDNTFTGSDSFADLTATTADINGGTLDNMQVDGETTTGILFVNDASDNLSSLSDQGSAGRVLVSNGAGVNPSFSTSLVEVFTTSGTWTAPTGVNAILLSMCGGGGGGAGGDQDDSGGGGGGGGAYVYDSLVNVTPASTYTVTVGAGAVAVAKETNGNDGNDSTFEGDNRTITAVKGVGGTKDASGGAGGAAAALDLDGDTTGTDTGASPNITGRNWHSSDGGAGGNGKSSPGGRVNCGGGAGGNSFCGIGGAGATEVGGADNSAPGLVGTDYGSGGGGGSSSDLDSAGGGAGAPGIVVIRYSISSTPS